ncbi:MAG: hypothetical protein IAF58_10700, partial [Leptolyngbya sp.]|nr:hypothetical protein [Candidatus Melainabacteria bacterium]
TTTATPTETPAGCPKGKVNSDGSIDFVAAEKPEEKSWFSKAWQDTKDFASKAVEVTKSAFESASGAIHDTLTSVWQKTFDKDATIKGVTENGKLTSLTATDNESNLITSDGKTTTVKDKWGNTSTYDSATKQVEMTDLKGGKYSHNDATGDTTYIGTDGTKLIRHRDGSEDFIQKDGTKGKLEGDQLSLERRKMSRLISEKNGIIDRVTTYHEGAVDVFNHGSTPEEQIPQEVRDRTGVHNYLRRTERVLQDGTKIGVDKDCTDGTVSIRHRDFTGEVKASVGPDGKPLYKLFKEGETVGKEVNFNDLPQWVQKRMRAFNEGRKETIVDGQPQIQVKPPDVEGRPSVTVGDITMSAKAAGIDTRIEAGANGQHFEYKNNKDGTQEGIDLDGNHFKYDSTNKDMPYQESDKDGNVIMKYNPSTRHLWTPEFESTPEGTRLANGNFISSDGSISNSNGTTIMRLDGSSPADQAIHAQIGSAVGSASAIADGVIAAAKVDPKNCNLGALEGAIGSLSGALALCVKTGNYSRINEIYGAISKAYSALGEGKAAQARSAIVLAAAPDANPTEIQRLASTTTPDGEVAILRSRAS